MVVRVPLVLPAILETPAARVSKVARENLARQAGAEGLEHLAGRGAREKMPLEAPSADWAAGAALPDQAALVALAVLGEDLAVWAVSRV